MIQRADESVNAWISRLVSRWKIEEMNRWIEESMNEWICESLNHWSKPSNQWINEWVNCYSDWWLTKQWSNMKQRSKEIWTAEAVGQRTNEPKQWISESMNPQCMNAWWVDGWMDGWMGEWATSRSNLFAEVPLLAAATYSLNSSLFRPLPLWTASWLRLLQLLRPNLILLRAASTVRFGTSGCTSASRNGGIYAEKTTSYLSRSCYNKFGNLELQSRIAGESLNALLREAVPMHCCTPAWRRNASHQNDERSRNFAQHWQWGIISLHWTLWFYDFLIFLWNRALATVWRKIFPPDLPKVLWTSLNAAFFLTF